MVAIPVAPAAVVAEDVGERFCWGGYAVVWGGRNVVTL